jgi:hypothetical protein
MSPIDEELRRAIGNELPEIDRLDDERLRDGVVAVWASFLGESSYRCIADAPAFPGLRDYDLARHTRHVASNCLHLAASLAEFSNVTCDREALLAAALVHDASKLVEREGPEGKPTELGKVLVHAQIGGVRCLELGLPPKVAYMVTYHPFTPPHVHVTPQYLEFVLLTWADLAAIDPVFMANGGATHLEIGKRFFSLD